MRHFARGSVALTQPLRLHSTRQHVGHIQSTNIGPRLVGTRQASRANNVHGRRDAVELGLSPLAPRLLQTRRTGARDRRHHGFTDIQYTPGGHARRVPRQSPSVADRFVIPTRPSELRLLFLLSRVVLDER